jgi:hypothetical protein
MAATLEQRRAVRDLDLRVWAMRKIERRPLKAIAAEMGVSYRYIFDRCKRGRQHALTLAYAEVGVEPTWSPSLRAATRAVTPFRVRAG